MFRDRDRRDDPPGPKRTETGEAVSTFRSVLQDPSLHSQSDKPVCSTHPSRKSCLLPEPSLTPDLGSITILLEPYPRPSHTPTRAGGGGTEITGAPRGPVLLWLSLLKEAAGCCPQIFRDHVPFPWHLRRGPNAFFTSPFLSPPSCLSANQVPVPSQGLRTLHPSWPTQGQRARSRGTPTPSPAILNGSREAPSCLPAWCPGLPWH